MTGKTIAAPGQRYQQLVDRFKAAWTFHQFLEGLQRIFAEDRVPGPPSSEFNKVYGRLKAVSDQLNNSAPASIQARLDEIQTRIEELTSALLEQDTRVSPALHRQFFQRVSSYDEAILTSLLRFCVNAQATEAWDADRVDKADVLMGKLAERLSGPGGGAERLPEVFADLWRESGAKSDSELARRLVAMIGEIREAAGSTASLSELRSLVETYRKLKHGLGVRFFEPQVVSAVVATNRVIKEAVKRLFQREERGIFADSERIFDLEGKVELDDQLDGELSRVRRELEEFERRVQEDNVRLSEVARMREQLRTLVARLGHRSAGGGTRAAAEPRGGETAAAIASEEATELDEASLLDGDYRELLGVLEGTEAAANPKSVTVSREVFPYRLEAREVTAFRRLAAGGDSDQSLERFVLRCAALRLRIRKQVEEINAILDDSAQRRTGPVFDRARRMTHLAEAYLGRLSRSFDQAVLEGRLVEAQSLQVLRMRLMREFSGLWLLAWPVVDGDRGDQLGLRE